MFIGYCAHRELELASVYTPDHFLFEWPMHVVNSVQVLEECLVNPSLTDYLENYHSSHDCEAQHLKMLLQQPTGRVSTPLNCAMHILSKTFYIHIIIIHN